MRNAKWKENPNQTKEKSEATIHKHIKNYLNNNDTKFSAFLLEEEERESEFGLRNMFNIVSEFVLVSAMLITKKQQQHQQQQQVKDVQDEKEEEGKMANYKQKEY